MATDMQKAGGLLKAEADKRAMGLYEKFRVERTDGASAPGGKHENCRYFVLDMDHDQFARVAIAAYAAACQDKYPNLARDLRDWVFKPMGFAANSIAREQAFFEKVATAPETGP